MNINYKVVFGSIYVLCLGIFLFFVFSYLDFKDLTNYSYIRDNTKELLDFKNNNYFLLVLLFSIFSIIWIIFLGFGSPLAIVSGFVFGKWIGTLLTTLSLSTGALMLYFLGKYFFYDFLKEKYQNKFNFLNSIFKNNELTVMTIYRFVGLVPFFLANLLPVIFNIRPFNYFFGTLIGILPSVFIFVSLGNGFSEALYQYDDYPSLKELIIEPGINLPIIGFVFVIILSYFVRNKFFAKKN